MGRRTLKLGLLVALVLALTAPAVHAGGKPVSGATTGIVGVVTNSTSGEVVAGAQVAIVMSGKGGRQVTITGYTDSAGAYQLVGDPGTYTQRIRIDGYCQLERPVTLVRGSMARADASIAPVNSIRGKVADQVTGAPVAGARIDIERREAGGFNTIVGSVLTDASGNYSFIAKAGGVYELRPNALGYYKTLWTCTLADGGSAVVNGSLIPLPTSTIQGRVIDSTTGLPLAGASARLELGDGHGNWTHVRTVLTDADGRYSLQAYAGPNRVTFSADGFISEFDFQWVTTGNEYVMDWALWPESEAVTITGTIIDSTTGRPLGGATVDVETECPQHPQTWIVRGTALTDANGSFSFRIAPGVSSLHIRATGYTGQVRELGLLGAGSYTVTERLYSPAPLALP